RDADDGVTVALRRQVIDEVDEAVLHSARLETVDDVHDQGSSPGRARNTGGRGLDGRHQESVYYGDPFSSSLAVGAGRALVWKLDDTDERPPLLPGPTTHRRAGPPPCPEHRPAHQPKGGPALRRNPYLP